MGAEINQEKITQLKHFIKESQDTNTTTGSCRRLSRKINNWVKENINEASSTRKQSYFQGVDKVAQHFYVEIKYNDKTYVADPTVHQFTYENWVARKADTYIPKEEIPDVGLITPDMDIFVRYV